MQALRLTSWQHDAEFADVPTPDPGPGQILVRVGGAGACHSDLHLMHDFTAGSLPFDPPFTLGHENAGWVEAVGPGVFGLEPGTPVAVYGPWGCGRCHRCRVGAENYCVDQARRPVAGGGLGADGGMAPFMLVPSARHLVELGDLDPVVAAPLTDAGLTPYHAVRRSLDLLVPGSTALVLGVGGLGHLAVQILRELTPATIVAVDERPEALVLAASLGADHTILPGPAAHDEILGRTGGRGVDVAIDLVGSPVTLEFAAALTRSLGHLTIVGLGGGSLPVGFTSMAYEVSVATTYWGSIPELMEVLALGASGRIR
ncbi:MAG: NAD(P)-dependent alcohol dehydrogenase, partial [Acidobacteria bacterium]|nr:NAD(P)-dependent alcohol dehydrogenase [Acidobacteriota bacterium]